MEQQNIYDNEKFFEGYQSLRKNELSANGLIDAGFTLERMGESYATNEIIKLKAKYKEQQDHSYYIYFKCRK